MNRFLGFILMVIVAYLFTGCGGAIKQLAPFPDQSKIVEDQNKGRIYIMGSPSFMNLASHYATVSVIADDKHIGYIAGHSYLCWEREPGVTTVSSYIGNSTSDVKLLVENGQVYYVLLNIFPALENPFDMHPGGGKIHARLERIDEEEGKKELLKCK